MYLNYLNFVIILQIVLYIIFSLTNSNHAFADNLNYKMIYNYIWSVSEDEDDSPIEKPKPKKPKPASKAKGGKSTAKNVNVSKLRQQTQHKQSSDIGASLIREKMKIVRKHEDDSESAELEIMVEKDMSLESLKKKLSSATGIPLNKLCIIARGEIVSDCPPETKIKELWSVDDIVVIYPVMENDAPQNKSNTIINLEG